MVEASASRLTIQLFGEFAALIDGRPLPRLHVRSADRLLAHLALSAPRLVASSAVLEDLWSDDHSPSNLHHAVAHLRSVLGEHAGCLSTTRGYVALDLARVDLDVDRFDRALRSGEPQKVEHADRLFGDGLLVGWDHVWVIHQRAVTRERLVRALRQAADLAEDAGEHETAARLLRRYIRRNPVDEPAWLRLMRLHAHVGDRLAAIDLYARYSERLRKATHLEPSPEMTSLYAEIVGQQRPPGAVVDTKAMGREPVGGAVPLGSACYVERAADAALQSALDHGEGTIVIRGPRQTGKSSLLAHGLEKTRDAGAQVIVTDFGTLTNADLASLDALCRWLALSTALQAGAEDYSGDEWRPFLAPVANLERYVLRRVLADPTRSCVWAMDDVDRLFGLPFARDFFAILRSWHGRRSFSLTDPWRRLTIVLVCATEAHLYIPDLNRSPFNVGERIDVGDFTAAQVAALNSRCGNVLSDGDLSRLRSKVDGHPYLVARSLHELRSRQIGLDELLRDVVADGGPFADHLRRLRRHVEADADLLEGVHHLLDGQPCSEECFFRLRSAGMVSGATPVDAKLRCGLYDDYFGRHLR